jgi:hypothetical protein
MQMLQCQWQIEPWKGTLTKKPQISPLRYAPVEICGFPRIADDIESQARRTHPTTIS